MICNFVWNPDKSIVKFVGKSIFKAVIIALFIQVNPLLIVELVQVTLLVLVPFV